MKDLVIVILGKEQDFKLNDNIQVIYSDGSNIKELVEKTHCKYITFIKEEDRIDKTYLEKVTEKIKEDFDCCFINYIIDYEYKNNMKVLTDPKELKDIYPYAEEYIWSFIFNRNKLFNILNVKTNKGINEIIEKEFEKRTAIGDIIYFHNPKGKKLVHNFMYTDIKRNEYYKNIIYFSTNCDGTFNGYISWVRNIGRCFAKKYDITMLYDSLNAKMARSFESYGIRCVKRSYTVNYMCDRLLVSYSDYHYPKNIFALEENYMFIHGNMSDYPNSAHYKNDIYSKYIGVSKITAKKAEGYFPTKKIDHVLNPFKIDNEAVKPHLKLVSAQRSSKIKCPERIEILANILDELEIPYTWNVFTDVNEGTNKGGLVYRHRTSNPMPYINDADYFVLLSDSEAMPYCILEALSLNTKVIVTPLPTYKELKIKDKTHGTIIPFEYFEKENKDKLVELVKRIYKDKDKKINFKLDTTLFDEYNNIFTR